MQILGLLGQQTKKVHKYFQLMVKDMELFVNGEKIHMNEFVRKVIHDVMMALISNLKDIELSKIERLDIS